MNQQVGFPVVGVHHLAYVVAPVTALLGQRRATRLLKHQPERSDSRGKLRQELHHLEEPLWVVGHGVWQVTEADEDLGLLVELVVAPGDPLLEEGCHLAHRELLEVVDEVAEIELEDDTVETDWLQLGNSNGDSLGVWYSLFDTFTGEEGKPMKLYIVFKQLMRSFFLFESFNFI